MLWGSIAWCSGLVEAVQSAARGVHDLKCFKVQFTAWCSDRMEGSNAESATKGCMAALKKSIHFILRFKRLCMFMAMWKRKIERFQWVAILSIEECCCFDSWY